jgi:hypothetical protein
VQQTNSAGSGWIVGQALPIFVALALYDLLKEVNQRHALLMLTLILVTIPIAFLNELNSVAALVLIRGVDFLSIFDKPQRDALAMLFLNLHGHGFDVAGILAVFGCFPSGYWCTGRAFFRASWGSCWW